jgi:hypothetical protein
MNGSVTGAERPYRRAIIGRFSDRKADRPPAATRLKGV